jgi:hypothetical protein
MGSGRFLIVTWDGGGNLVPCLALGSRLLEAGHQVWVMADSTTAQRVADLGMTHMAYTSVEPWPERVAFEDDPERFEAIRNGVAVAKTCSPGRSRPILTRWSWTA